MQSPFPLQISFHSLSLPLSFLNFLPHSNAAELGPGSHTVSLPPSWVSCTCILPKPRASQLERFKMHYKKAMEYSETNSLFHLFSKISNMRFLARGKLSPRLGNNPVRGVSAHQPCPGAASRVCHTKPWAKKNPKHHHQLFLVQSSPHEMKGRGATKLVSHLQAWASCCRVQSYPRCQARVSQSGGDRKQDPSIPSARGGGSQPSQGQEPLESNSCMSHTHSS